MRTYKQKRLRMNSMEVAALFKTYRTKKDLIRYAKKTPQLFLLLIQESLLPKSEDAWRAAWLLGHIQKPDDIRLFPYLDRFLEIMNQCSDGHQRQLLIILNKMRLNEDQQGLAFDCALTIWEAIGKIPSVRISAFDVLLRIAESHPELRNEIEHWAQPMYTDSLSPGIRNSLFRRLKK